MNKPEILTVIVTYNAMRWLERCLGSLRDSQMETDVIVVDNCSSDGTAEYIRKQYPSVMLVENTENLGFGKANNIGLRYAIDNGYDYVYLLNQDAWVFPDTFGHLVAAMEKHSEYDILSPIQMTASLESEDRNFKLRCMSGRKRYEDGYIYDVDFVMAAHWMVSRKCLLTTGGFSPVFPHYGEDDDYVHRALYHGFKVGFLMGTRAVHDRSDRSYDREMFMRRKLVTAKTRVCDPRRPFLISMLLQPLEMAAMSLYHRSWTIFVSIFSLIRAYPSLYVGRKLSKETGAYL